MSSKRGVDDYSVDELEQILYRKKRAQRRQRLDRLRAEGRVVEVDGLEPPAASHQFDSQPNEHIDKAAEDQISRDELEDEEETASGLSIQWKWIANRLLLFVEIGAVVGLIILALAVWSTSRELNEELAQVQEAQSASVALPTATATPVISVAVLPSGHKPPVNGRPPEPGEAGNIPAHLLPIINAYVPPPIPTPGPEQARRIQVPAINVDKPIVQGDDWEQLKKGVGQHIGSGIPGAEGNLVLSAHNDIYGEIFRNLDKIEPGDEIIVSTERQDYTYIVREIEVVEPTDVWVMEQTEHASTTLISCYPYLVNNKRIVIFADLADAGLLTGSSS